MCMDMSEQYVQRLIEVGCNRVAQFCYNNSRYQDIPSNIMDADIFDLGDGDYIVESTENQEKCIKIKSIWGLSRNSGTLGKISFSVRNPLFHVVRVKVKNSLVSHYLRFD